MNKKDLLWLIAGGLVLLIVVVSIFLKVALPVNTDMNLQSENEIEETVDRLPENLEKMYLFSKEEAESLYFQGYSIEDMNKAQDYAIESGTDKMRIIKARGKYPQIISWKKVIKKLNLDLRSKAEKLGLEKRDIEYFRKKGLSENEILEIAIKYFNGTDTLENMKNEVK